MARIAVFRNQNGNNTSEKNKELKVSEKAAILHGIMLLTGLLAVWFFSTRA